jgi:thiol-disulfide isomerase/thioredoxin
MKTQWFMLIVLLNLLTVTVSAQNSKMLSIQITAMSKEADGRKNIATMHRLIKKYHLNAVKNAEELDMMKGVIALNFSDAGHFDMFYKLINSIDNKFNQTSYLNMAADRMLRQQQHLPEAEVIASKTIKLYEYFKNDTAARSSGYSKDDWNRFMRMAAYPYYYTYSVALHTNRKDRLALYYLEKAIKSQKTEPLDEEATELYATLLISAGKDDMAFDSLYAKARIGKASGPMIGLLKKLYVKKGNTLSKANVFADSLQHTVNEAFLAETKSRMIIGKRAPNFNLMDINGLQVSLSQCRGKIVVLDFWATWCAPCKASMPVMKQLTYKYPNVVFLFIATQETGKDVVGRIKGYLKKQSFNFRVPVDRPALKNPRKYTVAAAYKIDGLPTKVVIDRNGNELFFTSGYTSAAEMTREMDAMITIAQGQ